MFLPQFTRKEIDKHEKFKIFKIKNITMNNFQLGERTSLHTTTLARKFYHRILKVLAMKKKKFIFTSLHVGSQKRLGFWVTLKESTKHQ